MNDEDLDFSTLAIRHGQVRSPEKEHREPIFMTSSFVTESAEESMLLFADKISGNVYSRYTNPTVRQFEKKIARLEETEDAVACASGMAAVTSLCMGLLKAGDHILCSGNIFGPIRGLIENYLNKFGIKHTYIYSTDPNQWTNGFADNTKLVFLETPSNPLCDIYDIFAIAYLSQRHGALLVVDNTFCTPALQNPKKLGADLVLHSATKYIDGQGRALGGVIAGQASIVSDIRKFVRTGGACLSPFNAWVLNSGLETLNIRMAAHCTNAMIIAKFLNEHPKVERVYFPGLEAHEGHAVAKRQQRSFGGIISFDLKADRKGVWSFIDHIKLISKTTNIGDVRSTVTHPATTTHGKVAIEERQKIGISDQLVRISVGLESTEDLILDIGQALEHVN